jgi:hypothetical protein
MLLSLPPSHHPHIHRRLESSMLQTGAAHVYLVKRAEKPVLSHSLSGRLYLSKSGWLLLAVPAALVRGAFDALAVPGAQLPYNSAGKLVPHISVASGKELEEAGVDPEQISERGHLFTYNLGPLKEVRPKAWKNVGKVWFITVQSKALEDFRVSYGLSRRPRNNKHEFHITIARRLVDTLREDSEVTKLDKGASDMTDSEFEAHQAMKQAAEDSGTADKDLDVNGGVLPTDPERARRVDLISMPRGVSGTTCSNCMHVRKSDQGAYCTHPEVDMPVNERMCCIRWDMPGVIRHHRRGDDGRLEARTTGEVAGKEE